MTPWLSRTWNFENLTGTYMHQVDRMERSPLVLAALVENMPHEILVEKPMGKWSVHEHSGHLLTLESLWIARLDDFVMEHEVLRAWNPDNPETEAAQFNLHRLGKLVEDFATIRQAHVNMLRKLEPVAETMIARHPRLERDIRLLDHVYFVAEHDHHHLEAIGHILSKILN